MENPPPKLSERCGNSCTALNATTASKFAASRPAESESPGVSTTVRGQAFGANNLVAYQWYIEDEIKLSLDMINDDNRRKTHIQYHLPVDNARRNTGLRRGPFQPLYHHADYGAPPPPADSLKPEKKTGMVLEGLEDWREWLVHGNGIHLVGGGGVATGIGLGS